MTTHLSLNKYTNVLNSDYSILQMIFPEDKMPDKNSTSFFNDNDISMLIPEGIKQRFINQALFDKINKRAFSMFDVGFEHCEDHFPQYPILPMAKLGQIMAQVGSLLFVLTADEENPGKKVPIVKRVLSINSFIANVHGNKKMFIIPGDKLLIVAEHGKEQTEQVSIFVYTEASLIASMELIYEVLNQNFFIKLYERQLKNC